MSSWSQLADQLSAVERQITAIKLKAEEKISAEKEKVALVAKKREELVMEHKKAMNSFLEEQTRSLEGQAAKAQEEIAQLGKQKMQAERERSQADADASASEERSRQLERKVKELHGLLDRARDEHEQRMEQAVDSANTRVQMSFEAARRRNEHACRHASNVQDGGFASMEHMENEVRVKKNEADLRSKERSRFKELFHVCVRGAQEGYNKTDSALQRARIVQDWHGDWTDSGPALQLPARVLHEAKRGLLESSGRPRSVDRHKLAAMQVAKDRERRGNQTARTMRPSTSP